MRLIVIEGSRDVLLGLVNIQGLEIHRHTSKLLGDDRWALEAYATPEAVLEVEARGVTVTTLVSDQEHSDYIASIITQITDDGAIT